MSPFSPFSPRRGKNFSERDLKWTSLVHFMGPFLGAREEITRRRGEAAKAIRQGTEGNKGNEEDGAEGSTTECLGMFDLKRGMLLVRHVRRSRGFRGV